MKHAVVAADVSRKTRSIRKIFKYRLPRTLLHLILQVTSHFTYLQSHRSVNSKNIEKNEDFVLIVTFNKIRQRSHCLMEIKNCRKDNSLFPLNISIHNQQNLTPGFGIDAKDSRGGGRRISKALTTEIPIG